MTYVDNQHECLLSTFSPPLIFLQDGKTQDATRQVFFYITHGHIFLDLIFLCTFQGILLSCVLGKIEVPDFIGKKCKTATPPRCLVCCLMSELYGKGFSMMRLSAAMPFLYLTAVIPTAVAAPAYAAGWNVGHFTDRMTDRPESFATLPDSLNIAKIYVGCVNGRLSPDIVFPIRVGAYKVDASFRFDFGPITMRMADISPDGKEIWLWLTYPPSGAELYAKVGDGMKG